MLVGGETPKDFEIIRYGECDSTNTRAREYAKRLALTGEARNAVFIAERQSAGRGRRGRSFLSERGGIYVSFLFFAEEKPLEITGITARAAVISARAIDGFCGTRCEIKWVNDLYLNGRKIAGILTEGEFDENGNLRYFIVGMGINVYKIEGFEQIMPIATTLEDEIKSKPDKEKLCSLLIEKIGGELMAESARSEMLSEYRERCNLLGRRVEVTRGDERYEAKALEVLDDYSLLVELDSGEKRILNSGEVSAKRSAEA